MKGLGVKRGRVVRVSGMQCLVDIDGEEWQCDVRGRLKEGPRQATSPVAVGDWVEVTSLNAPNGIVESVGPRRAKFSRAASGSRPFEQIIASNLDLLVIVVALAQPVLRPGFIDRAIVMALKGHIEPVVCINKVDLDSEEKAHRIGDVYRQLGYTVIYTSAKTGKGIERLEALLNGRVSALVGHSGVGKSSLLNAVDPSFSIKTQEMMRKHDRGRHTTTAVQLYRLDNDSYVVDCPGIKTLQLWQVDTTSLAEFFVEMVPLIGDCQFRDCTHLQEPGCAIRYNVEKGSIDTLRYQGYERIMASLI
jgi:ribosome biogenesis GTPase